MQTARWSESPGDLQRYGLDQAHILAELGNDQDMLNDLLISTSLGTSVCTIRHARLQHQQRTPGEHNHTCASRKPLLLCLRMPHKLRETWRCQACYSVTQLQQMRKGLVETVQLPPEWASRLGHESGEPRCEQILDDQHGEHVTVPHVTAKTKPMLCTVV